MLLQQQTEAFVGEKIKNRSHKLLLHEINFTYRQISIKSSIKSIRFCAVCWQRTNQEPLRPRSDYNALQSHQCCWLLFSPVSSILVAAQDGEGPAPGCRPDAHTPPGESDTHPAAAPHRGRQPGPRCSPVWRMITNMSQVFTGEELRLSVLEALALRRSA